MSKAAVIRLDPSRPYSEVRGERTVDDPHYRVVTMQGRKVGNKIVMLPFDASGELVPDDGKKEPYKGLNVDGKEVTHHPLYNDDMRGLVARLMKKAAEKAADPETPDEEEEELGEVPGDKTDEEINLVSWLKGEVRYMPTAVRAAVKARYHVNHATLPPLVEHLVDDEKLVPREQVCRELAKMLKA